MKLRMGLCLCTPGILVLSLRSNYLKINTGGPQPWLKSDSAQGNPPIQHWMTQPLACQ